MLSVITSLQSWVQRHPVATLLMVTSLGLLPLLYPGFPASTHDGALHLPWVNLFSEQFWSGELYPRWLNQIDQGLGGPVFYYYPPMEGYLVSLFYPLESIDGSGRLRLGIVLALSVILSGLFTYRWLSETSRKRGAVLTAALFYALAPYHLTVDIFMRGAVSEALGFLWVPLIFHGIYRQAQSARPKIISLHLVVGVVGLLLTHLLTAMIILPVALLYAVVTGVPDRALRRYGSIGVTFLLGAGIAAVYIVPALLQSSWVNLQKMWTEWNCYRDHFVDDLNISGALSGESMLFPLFLAGTFLLYSFILLLPLLRRGIRSLHGKWDVLFWGGLLLGSLIFCTPISLPVWELVGPLQNLQFPWRFLLLGTLAISSFIVALAELDQSDTHRWRRRIPDISSAPYLIPAILVLAMAAGIVRTWVREPKLTQNSVELAQPMVPREYLPPCVIRIGRDLARREIVRSYRGGVVVAQCGSREVSILEDQRNILLHVKGVDRSAEPQQIVLWRYYYPLWKAEADGVQLETRCVEPYGLLGVSIPPDVDTLRVYLATGSGEKIGLGITLGSSLLVLLLIIFNQRVDRTDRPTIPR